MLLSGLGGESAAQGVHRLGLLLFLTAGVETLPCSVASQPQVGQVDAASALGGEWGKVCRSQHPDLSGEGCLSG